LSNLQYITHISADGDRWDLLSWKYYGDPTLFGPIVMANPGIPIEPVLVAGLAVSIPLLLKKDMVAVNLPPWKRINS